MKTKILITGGSGLVGGALTTLFENEGYEVAHLSRRPDQSKNQSFYWNYETGIIDAEAMEFADVVIHLAGENIFHKKWTKKQKDKIISSRVETTKLIKGAIQAATQKPRAFISASAVGYYGSMTSEHIFTEDDQAGTDFLAKTAIRWEASAQQIQALGIPTAIIRIAVVMSEKGGALPNMLLPVKWGLGAAIGSGKQWIPWIALEDLCRMFLFVLEQKLWPPHSGNLHIYNAVSNTHINNKELMKLLAKSFNRPFFLPPVPGFIFSLILGERARIILNGSRVSSEKLKKEGFEFRITKIQELFQKK